MHKRFRREKSALTQVQSFMDQNPALLAGVNASDARQALDRSVEGLTAGEAEQGLHRRLSKQSHVVHMQARTALLKQQMRAVAAAAGLKVTEEPKLVLIVAPRARISTAKLLVAAAEMVAAATPFAGVLSPVLGVNYLDKLRQSIVVVEQAQGTVKESRARGVAATKDVTRRMHLGRLALRALHPLVSEALAGEPKLFDEWNARRKKVGLSRADAPAQSNTPADDGGLPVLPVGQEVKSAG